MTESESRVNRMLGSLSSGIAKLWAMARGALMDLRESSPGKRAASTLHELKESDATKRAATALHDLRESDASKRAAAAWQDLRQREAVRKAGETARRTMHDLRSGHGSESGTGGTTVP